jgi:hypothetical protein
MDHSDEADRSGHVCNEMAKRNPYKGTCGVCGTHVQAGEGTIEQIDTSPRWRILCVEPAATGALDPPKPIDASRLPSIHGDDRKFER